jgi:hypothetical protein
MYTGNKNNNHQDTKNIKKKIQKIGELGVLVVKNVEINAKM